MKVDMCLVSKNVQITQEFAKVAMQSGVDVVVSESIYSMLSV